MTTLKAKQKVATPLFERPGFKTPVLRGKKGETLSAFKARMAKVGWLNLEQVGLHEAPEPSVYHAGAKDQCKFCKRLARRSTLSEARTDTTKDFIKERTALGKSKEDDGALKSLDSAAQESPKELLPTKMNRGAAIKITKSDESTVDEKMKELGYLVHTKSSKGKANAFIRPDTPMNVPQGKGKPAAKVSADKIPRIVERQEVELKKPAPAAIVDKTPTAVAVTEVPVETEISEKPAGKSKIKDKLKKNAKVESEAAST